MFAKQFSKESYKLFIRFFGVLLHILYNLFIRNDM